MQANWDEIQAEILHTPLESTDQIESFRIGWLGKKGRLTELFELLKHVPLDQKKMVGAKLNEAKIAVQERIKEATEHIERSQSTTQVGIQDPTRPSYAEALGSLHPITIVRNRIVQIFERLGFSVAEGPEIEDDWHNFTALNFPPDHPAREMQDTFFIEKGDVEMALRTHTSSVQIRTMSGQTPPIRCIAPGRVYRNEAISARAHCLFHQIEGFYIDQHVSFKDLKDTLYHFAKELFGAETKIRFRPSFFPFTEPSAEMDISCLICKGKGCAVCKHSGWVEIGGAGMIHPNVMRHCSIDPENYTGYAFGMGIERITMLKYQIKDLRLFTENDIRFLRQFVSEN
jgi:phenylalanyl-tRNA synthetase alpha chain